MRPIQYEIKAEYTKRVCSCYLFATEFQAEKNKSLCEQSKWIIMTEKMKEQKSVDNIVFIQHQVLIKYLSWKKKRVRHVNFISNK